MGGAIKPGALVAAAGRSSRMGRFKPLLPLEHGSLLETGLRSLREAGVEPLFVVTGYQAEKLSPILAAANACEIVNPSYESGDMFSSVRLGLARAARECDRLFFLPGDVALFSRHSLLAMNRCMTENDADLILPHYCGRGGHPVLMGRACMEHILRHNGEKGLRGGFDTFHGKMIPLELPDPGLVQDADTPEDYRRLAAYEKDRAIPDRAVCHAVLRWFHTPSDTVLHCEEVASVATELAKKLNAAGCRLNERLVLAGALLHDVAKGEARHAEVGQDVLRALEYPEVASVVGAHTELPDEAERVLDERAVVYLADKLVQGVRRVSVAERFAPALERFENASDIHAAVLRRYRAARRVEERINAIIHSGKE